MCVVWRYVRVCVVCRWVAGWRQRAVSEERGWLSTGSPGWRSSSASRASSPSTPPSVSSPASSLSVSSRTGPLLTSVSHSHFSSTIVSCQQDDSFLCYSFYFFHIPFREYPNIPSALALPSKISYSRCHTVCYDSTSSFQLYLGWWQTIPIN